MSKGLHFVKKVGIAALSASVVLPLWANPYNPTVVHGSAQFTAPNSNTLNVTNSANAIINWQSFSIGQGQTTNFIQPSAQSAVLNRVTGADPSALLGQLNSNGRVFLINPNGILVGAEGVINTAGFVASTLDINDADFLNGNYHFIGDGTAGIQNHGVITTAAGGEIVLIAPQIENHGVLSAEEGNLLLAAGQEILLTSFDLEGIQFHVKAPEHQAVNLGQLLAEQGSVGVFAGSLQNNGRVEANAVGTDAAGNIVLFADADIDIGADAVITANGANGGDITIQSQSGTTLVAGSVEAKGSTEKGGRVKVLGQRVGVVGTASVNASGDAGGGEVLIGGDYRGENAAVQNAQASYVGQGAQIAADAISNGDGGRVIVWADDVARSYGQISATGGVHSGNGGFVETSGKVHLDVGGYVPDVTAMAGTAGTWLLDPRDITIVSSAGVGIIDLDAGVNAVFQPSADSSALAATLITAALDAGGNVIIDTSEAPASGTGAEAGNISFGAASIDVTGLTPGTLTMRAHNDITINGSITSSGGALAITLVADQDGDNVGGVTIASGIAINSRGGDVGIRAGGDVFFGPIGVINTADVALTSGGNVDIQSAVGSIIMDGTGNAARIESVNGTVTLTANNGSINLIDVAAIGQQNPSGRNIILSATDLNLNGNANQIRANTGNITLNLNAPVGLGGGVGAAQITAAEFAGFSADTVIINSPGDIRINQMPGSVNFGNLTLNSNQNIQFDQPSGTAITVPAFVTLNATSGAVINNSIGFTDVVAQNLFVNTLNSIDVETDIAGLNYNNTGAGNVNIINTTLNGPLTINAGNNGGIGSTRVRHNFTGSSGNGFIIGGNINQGSGNLEFEVLGAEASMNNNANIALGGGGSFLVGVSTPGFGFTNNAGSTITGTADIIIQSNEITLNAGGAINAGATAKTVLRRASSGNWTLGGDLTAAELNTITGIIAIGDGSATVNNLTLTNSVAFLNNQDFLTEIVGTMDFQQSVGTGITGTNFMRINANQVSNAFASSLDLGANRLELNTVNGIGGINALETQVGQLIATNTTSGTIDISNSGGNLTIVPSGIRNLSAGATDDAIVNNAGGNLIVNGLVEAVGGGVTVGVTSGGNVIIDDDIFALNGTIAVNSTSQNVLFNSGTVRGGAVFLNAGGEWRMAGGLLDVGSGVSTVSNMNLLGGNAVFAGDTTFNGGIGGGGGILTLNGGTQNLSANSALGELRVNGADVVGGSIINVAGSTILSAGGIGAGATLVTDGGLLINGPVLLNGVINNRSNAVWTGVADITGTGTFNNRAAGNFTINNNATMNAAFDNYGIVTKNVSGITIFTNGYRQISGQTRLNNGGLDIASQMDILGGELTGIGVVRTPLVNHVAGKIAPGSSFGPVPTQAPVVGTMLIDGDLVMGNNAVISLDLLGSNNTGGSAGVNYDRLRVTGNTFLNGELEMVVNVPIYRGAINDFYTPFVFNAVGGGFDRIAGLPSGYTFDLESSSAGPRIVMTGAPFVGSLTKFIIEDELQTLNRNVDEQMEELQKLKRRKETQEARKKEEEQKKRRALFCT